LITTLIVDDEPLARDGIRLLLEEDGDIGAIFEAKNGKQAVAKIRKHRPNVVFLDVQVPELDGFAVLREVGPETVPSVIFVTAYDRYAVEAFEIQAVDYLMKPFSRQRFGQALDRAKARLRAGEPALDVKVLTLLERMARTRDYLERLVVKSARGTIFLSSDDVEWIEAAENYVRLHVGKEEYLIQTTMNSISSRLNPSKFVRIHRSLIANVDYICAINPAFHGEYLLRLKNGVQLRSGRTYARCLKQLLTNPF
jgi:two-component system LytT family response regulator